MSMHQTFQDKLCTGLLAGFTVEVQPLRWKNGKAIRVEITLVDKTGERWPEPFDPDNGNLEELKERLINRVKKKYPKPESPKTKHDPLLNAIRVIFREELERKKPPGKIRRFFSLNKKPVEK